MHLKDLGEQEQNPKPQGIDKKRVEIKKKLKNIKI